MTTKRRFEHTTGGTSKYWEVEVVNAKVIVHFGQRWSRGQVRETEHESAAAAATSAAAAVREKLRKGYREVGPRGGALRTSARAQAKASSKASARAKTSSKASAQPKPGSGLLTRLQTALEKRYPQTAAALRPGASDAAIARLIELSPGLPASFIELMRWHDGARDDMRPLDGLVWLDVKGIISVTKMMRDIVAQGHYAAYRPDEWWSRGWVQFADDQSGYGALVIDLHGSFGGQPGQVLWAAAKDPTRTIVAPSFDAWLATFTAIVEKGYLEEDDAGTTLRHDSKAWALQSKQRGYRRCAPRPVEIEAEAGGVDESSRATRGARPVDVPASARWLVAASGAKVRHWFVAHEGKSVTVWAGEDLARLRRTVEKKRDETAAANHHDEQLRKQLYAGFVLGGVEKPRNGDVVCALHVGDGCGAELIDLSPDGRTLAVGTILAEAKGANLYLVDIVTGRRRRIHEEKVAGEDPQTFVHRVAFGPEGKEIYYQLNNELRVIPRAGGKPKVVARMKEGPLNPHVSRFEFDASRARMLCFDGPSPCVRKVGGKQNLLKLPANTKTTEYREAAISRSGKLIAVVYQSRGVIYSHEDAMHDKTSEIQIWSVDQGKLLHRLPSNEGYLRRLGFTPDDRALVVGTYSGVAALDLSTGKSLWKRESVEWAYSPDGSRLAVAGRGVTGQVLDARTRRAKLAVRGPWELEHSDIHDVSRLLYSDDGKLLIKGNNGGRVYVWATGQSGPVA
jgi:cell wall assembly regulator SMI1/predicted DNA-binding WGR domain protein/WD40 repeat protein